MRHSCLLMVGCEFDNADVDDAADDGLLELVADCDDDFTRIDWSDRCCHIPQGASFQLENSLMSAATALVSEIAVARSLENITINELQVNLGGLSRARPAFYHCQLRSRAKINL